MFHLDILDMGREPQLAANHTFQFDMTPLENAFSRRDFGEIIENSQLFWFAFCKAYSQIKGKDSDAFTTSIQGKSVTISGKEHIIPEIQEFVEEIRKLFVKGHVEKRGFVLLPITITDKCFIREKNEMIDMSCWLDHGQVKLFKGWFRDFIKPTMQRFCESIGAVCSDIVVSQNIVDNDQFGVQNRTIKAFQIDWVSGDHLVYPIAAKKIPQRDDLQKSLYTMYRNQILCDLTLIAKDGEIKSHSIPLFIYGGETIQKMLTCNMKESIEKVIHFSEFSLNTVRSFVDFLYLGEKGLEPESILKRNIDLGELIQMAHTYQVQPLIDCCTNCLCLFSTTEDIKKINFLAKLYENDHLRELHTYLLLKLNANQPGFIKI